MPSWQARVFNFAARQTLKPLLRFTPVRTLQGLQTRTERFESARPLAPGTSMEPISAPGFQGERIRLDGDSGRRVCLYFPGGGFVLRAAGLQRSFASEICRTARCEVWIMHYRLAPQTPFPGGLEDCVAAYHHLLANGHRPEDITLIGESAGGGLVLSTLLALRDETTPMPARAIVISPVTDFTFSGVSRQRNARRDPILPAKRLSALAGLYSGTAVTRDRYLSPALADFDDLPPMMGIVGDTEVLLDDCLRAADQANKAGVPFHLEVWKGMAHAFPLFAFMPESRIAIQRLAAFIHDEPLAPAPRMFSQRQLNWNAAA